MDQNNQFNQEQETQSSSTDTFYQSGFSSDFTPPPPVKTSNGYAIASLILGIVSIVLCCCCPPAIIITAALAIIFAVLSRQGGRMNGQAIGGMICGIASLVLSLIVVLFYVLSFAGMTEEERDMFYEEFYNAFASFYEEHEGGVGISPDGDIDISPDGSDTAPEGDKLPTGDSTEEAQKNAEEAAAAAAASPVIEKIKALKSWPAVTKSNYESLKKQYEETVAAYDLLDKQAKTLVSTDDKKAMNDAKSALKAYETALKEQAAEQEHSDKLSMNRIVYATVDIDGEIDDIVEEKSSPLTLTREQAMAWENDAAMRAIGAGLVGGDDRFAISSDTDTEVSFYFAYDDEYLYITEKRCDLDWLFTTTDFRKPYAGDGSLLWFVRASTYTTEPICGIQWNAGTKSSVYQSNPRPGTNVPVFGLFSGNNQLAAVKMGPDAWERAISWDESTFYYVLEVKIPFEDLGFTAEDIESDKIAATFCTVDIVNEDFDGNTNKLWYGMGYQMQYPGVNNWKWSYPLIAVQ